MAQTDLRDFVRESLAKREPRKRINDALLKAGWQKDEVEKALDSFADVEFSIPVPRRKPYLSAREAFMYLVMFFTLYVSAFAFGTLLFQFINYYLPDVAMYYFDPLGIIRQASASLVVSYPVFLFVAWRLQKAIGRDPEKRSSLVRKWLTYFTLFIAAGIIIGDLITLVSSFLQGEITLRFILKVSVVGGIAGAIFGYYFWDLRGEEKTV